MSDTRERNQEKNSLDFIRWTQTSPPTPEEAEAKLHLEGYECISWYDVPGTTYPRHRHHYDECLWVIKGQMKLTLGEQEILLNAGDKIYLKAGVIHRTEIPLHCSATYLVGQRRSSKL